MTLTDPPGARPPFGPLQNGGRKWAGDETTRQFVVSYPDPLLAAILLWAEVGLETRKFGAASIGERLIIESGYYFFQHIRRCGYYLRPAFNRANIR